MMIPPAEFARAFLETFDKSAICVFRQWLECHRNIGKWIIAADFALRDATRKNDCFAFTLIPYDDWPDNLVADIKSQLPKDLKDAKTLDEGAVAWLRDSRRFHIAIPMNRERQYYGLGGKAAAVARESIAMTLEAMVRAERGADQIGRMKELLNRAKANGFNIGLFTDLTLLAIYIPLVTLLLARERQLSGVAWFCDRDSMLTFSRGVIWDYALENFFGLAEAMTINTGNLSPIIAIPDKSSGKEIMWYDDYIRPADWLAGTLATWDYETNLLPAEPEKYLRMVEDVLPDSKNSVFLPVTLDRNGLRITRLCVSKASPSESDDKSPT